MPNINPFPVSSFQSILDWFIVAMKSIRTPALFGKILPFIVVVGVVGVIVFWFLGLWFRVFAEISDRTFRRGADNVDDFVSGWKILKQKRELSQPRKYDLWEKIKIQAKRFELDS